jgi:hypothetical protein
VRRALGLIEEFLKELLSARTSRRGPEESYECERNKMAEIDVKFLRNAVNIVLDHVINDLGLEKISIEGSSDYYWHCPASEVHDMSKKPIGLDVGSLPDDIDFVNLISRGRSGDVAYNLIYACSLLRYIAENVKRGKCKTVTEQYRPCRNSVRYHRLSQRSVDPSAQAARIPTLAQRTRKSGAPTSVMVLGD